MPGPASSATGVLDRPRRAVPSDRLTVAAWSVLAYAAANVLHEGVGHVGACLLVGGAPRMLTSVSFDCSVDGTASAAARLVASGGTVVNLIAGGLAVFLYRSLRTDRVAARYFLWLFAAINIFQAFGYFLFSGVSGIGDWAAVMSPTHPEWAWRVGLAAFGGALYYLAVRRAFAALGRFIGGRPSDRHAVGRTLSLVPYPIGAVLYCLSGVLNPNGLQLLAISAAAASLGGTSGLAWGHQFLRSRGDDDAPDQKPVHIARDMRVIVTAVVVTLLFVFVLGPGVALGGR
jgi:hypothetical protein